MLRAGDYLRIRLCGDRLGRNSDVHYTLGSYRATMLRVLILAASTATLGCSALPNPNAPAQAPDLKEMKAGGVSFVYSAKDFGEIKIEKVKKETVLGKEGPADGESPEHYCFYLKDRRPLPALGQGPRYFFPTNSFVCAFPLEDATVRDFRRAYFPLNSVAGHLRKLLREHPSDLELWHRSTKTDIPDFPYEDAFNSIVSRFQYLNFRSGTGILFLTQFSNEMLPNPVNNEELTLDFQGLTHDGGYYIAARLAVTHPSLPRGIDFTGDIKRDMDGNYLKKEEEELDRLPEESFRPPLKSLKAMLSSIHIE